MVKLELLSKHFKKIAFLNIKVFMFIVVNLDNVDKQQEDKNPL